MNAQEASKALCNAVTSASSYPLSDAGGEYLAAWCAGTGRDHEPREEILASDEGPKLLADLCEVIVEVGDLLDRILEARCVVSPRDAAVQELLPMDLWVFGRVLSASGTRFCNDDPEPVGDALAA